MQAPCGKLLIYMFIAFLSLDLQIKMSDAENPDADNDLGDTLGTEQTSKTGKEPKLEKEKALLTKVLTKL